MPAQATLSDAIDAFIIAQNNHGFAAKTIRNQRGELRKFLTHTGNIYCRSITNAHVDDYLGAQPYSDSTYNLACSYLSIFFKFARNRGWMPVSARLDPMVNTRRRKEFRQARFRVPVADFPRLLDLAEANHPRDRMVVALGLYLFLREGEMRALRKGDVNLETGTLKVTVFKSRLADEMPITEDLDEELRRWFTTYTVALGTPLTSDMFLLPQLKPAPGHYDRQLGHIVGATRGMAQLVPTKPFAHPHRAVQRALESYGAQTHREGCHTLRRSGARALFDDLADRGYDKALETVSSMLHHEQMSTTQLYLGLNESRHRRDDVLRGKRMFLTRRHVGEVIRLDHEREARR